MLNRFRHRAVMSIVLGLVMAGWTITITGCNTVKGAGKDVESVGEAGQEAINNSGTNG